MLWSSFMSQISLLGAIPLFKGTAVGRASGPLTQCPVRVLGVAGSSGLMSGMPWTPASRECASHEYFSRHLILARS
jgi:hypothetical protein